MLSRKMARYDKLFELCRANPRAVADAYDALSAVVTLDRERDGSAKHPTGLAATKPSNGSQRTTAALEETQAGGGLHVDSY
jgi:hypothetical protein